MHQNSNQEANRDANQDQIINIDDNRASLNSDQLDPNMTGNFGAAGNDSLIEQDRKDDTFEP